MCILVMSNGILSFFMNHVMVNGVFFVLICYILLYFLYICSRKNSTDNMRILVTGAKGFVGKNLCSQLQNIKDGKALWYAGLKIDEIYQYDIDSSVEDLDSWCRDCDIVFNLAGVNRPQKPEEFVEGNYGFVSILLEKLKKYNNTCPVMLSSSVQASLSGRFGTSEYGKSKKAGEDLFFSYGEETGARILVYRFPNIFGKWCRPNYNSAIATFCHNIANGLPIQVNDRTVEMELVYVDDLVEELISAISGNEHHCDFDGVDAVPSEKGKFCYVPVTHKVTLGEIVDMIYDFKSSVNPGNGQALTLAELQSGSLRYKLMSTFLSYLPQSSNMHEFKMNVDQRGSFTELFHTLNHGQVSINISKPGVTKGQHWHHSKWETFVVVAGHGLIQMRKEGTDEVLNYEVSGDKIQAIHMLPGFTHNIINLSDSEDLVTVMYCNEIFNPNRADTYFDQLENNK